MVRQILNFNPQNNLSIHWNHSMDRRDLSRPFILILIIVNLNGSTHPTVRWYDRSTLSTLLFYSTTYTNIERLNESRGTSGDSCEQYLKNYETTHILRTPLVLELCLKIPTTYFSGVVLAS